MPDFIGHLYGHRIPTLEDGISSVKHPGLGEVKIIDMCSLEIVRVKIEGSDKTCLVKIKDCMMCFLPIKAADFINIEFKPMVMQTFVEGN